MAYLLFCVFPFLVHFCVHLQSQTQSLTLVFVIEEMSVHQNKRFFVLFLFHFFLRQVFPCPPSPQLLTQMR